MLPSTLLFALMGTAAANKVGMRIQKGAQKNLLKLGAGGSGLKNNQGVNVGLADDGCYSFEESCDSLWCIPLGGECCAHGDGSYCEVGKYCVSGGCCDIGEICTGDASGCDEGTEACGADYCMPEGSVCCDTSGYYCDAGETCTSDGFCELGGSSGNDDDDEGECYSFQEVCDDGCMPAGSVCCGNGYYCYEGDVCEDDGTCSPESSSSDDDDDDDSSDDADETVTASETTASPTYSLRPVPTGFNGGGGEEDEGDDAPEDTGDDEGADNEEEANDGGADDESTEDEGSDGGSDGGNSPADDAGSVSIPSLLVGLVAALPLAL